MYRASATTLVGELLIDAVIPVAQFCVKASTLRNPPETFSSAKDSDLTAVLINASFASSANIPRLTELQSTNAPVTNGAAIEVPLND